MERPNPPTQAPAASTTSSQGSLVPSSRTTARRCGSRETHAATQKALATAREEHEEKVRLAAERAEAEERARGEEAAARLKRELKRLEQRAAQFDARVENLRAEKDAAVAEERSRREKEEEKTDESKASLALARRASDGMLLATRSLATRLLRLSAAVGHTVGAAARESRRRAGQAWQACWAADGS